MALLGPISETILNRAPRFLRGKNIGRFLESAGLVMDTALQTLAEGFKLSNPLVCDASALPAISKDRGVRIYDSEPEASQRYRLSQSYPLHRRRGSHQGEMRNLQPYFLGADGLGPLPRIRIVHQSGTGVVTWHTLDPDGTYSTAVGAANWDFDGQTAKWSRFWVIVYDTSGGAAVGALNNGTGHYDDAIAEYDDGITVYDGLSAGTARDIVAMVIDWKAAHSRLAGFLIAHDANDFDPAQAPSADPDGWTNFPSGGNWGSPVYTSGPYFGLISRNPRASFIYEDNP